MRLFRQSDEPVQQDAAQLEPLQVAYAALLGSVADADRATLLKLQAQVKTQLEAIAATVGLKGALKPDAKWTDRIVEERGREHTIGRIQSLANRIASIKSFDNLEVERALDDLKRIPIKELKEYAKRLSIAAIGTKPDVFLLDLLEKLSGISSLPCNPRVVEDHVQRLRQLYANSLESLPTGEIKDELKQLKALPIGDLVRIAEQFGLEEPGKKAPPILKRIENKLTATYKARMANQV